MCTTERPLALVLALLLTCAAPRVAWSDTPTAAEKESARGMMDAGHAQRDAGHHEAALALFQGADAIMHVPTTGLEVAREQIALGRLVEARDTLQAVLRTPAASDEPGAFRAARRAAIALDDDLVKRIPALRIDVAGNPTRVSVDGASVPLQALVGPFRVDPGHHVILATTAAGDARREVDVTEGQTVPVDLVAPAAASPAAPGAGGPADAGGSVDLDSTTGSAAPGPIVPWLRWGGLGLAAAGIGVGTVTGLMAISAKNSAENGCVNGMCPPATWNDLDSARTTSTIATIAFAAAGAGAALVVVSYLLPPAKPAAAPGGAASLPRTLTPWVGPVGAGVRGTF
jgi:hypothetical protein